MTRYDRNYLIRRYLYGPALKGFCRLYANLEGVIPEAWYLLNRPIFIVGCSRSGTTVFIEHFRRHPDLCDWSEAAQILDLEFYDRDADHFKDETCVTRSDAFRLRSFFGLRTRLMRKKRFVNKHPQNSLRMRYLKRIFLDAIFVHLIRDGRAVVHSNLSRTGVDQYRKLYPLGNFVKPVRWREYMSLSPIEQFSHQWVDVVRAVRATAAEILKGKEYLELRYEDFCSDPKKKLKEVDEFCGLDWEKRNATEIPDSLPMQNSKWRERMNEEEIEVMEAIIGTLNRELGYL